MSRYSNKRVFVFFVDFIVAAMILPAGTAYILFNISTTADPGKSRIIADDIAREIYTKRLIELDYQAIIDGHDPQDRHAIHDLHKSRLQQVGEFFALYERTGDPEFRDAAHNLTELTFVRTIPRQFSYVVQFYNPDTDEAFEVYRHEQIPFERASAASTTKTVISGIDRDGYFYGPYLFEVNIWV